MKQINVLVLEKKDIQSLISSVTQQPLNNITVVGDKELEVRFVFNVAPVAQDNKAPSESPAPDASK